MPGADSAERSPDYDGSARQPLFLFSLPRSGSTLLQRVLAAHPAITTASEPWILLPLIYAYRRGGAYTEYNHVLGSSAVRGFAAQLTGGRGAFDAALRDFVLRVYAEVP